MASQEQIREAIKRIMQANAERPNSGHRPPNLQTTDDTHENCSTCEHWEGGFCKLYDYRTQPDQVCESWTPVPEK